MEHKAKILATIMATIAIAIIIIIVGVLYFTYVGIPVGSGNTSSLNCGGLTVHGDYYYMVIGSPFGVNGIHNIKLTVWSINLPPEDFDVYILTHNQFLYGRIPINGGGIGFPHYLYKWDLSYLWNSSHGSYYLSKKLHLKTGDYIVISNDYIHIFQGVYGSAKYQLTTYL